MKKLTIQTARKFLEQEGYYVDNLWHLDDVMESYECDEETAWEILDSAVSNDWITEQINVVISDEAESIYELELKEL